MYIYAFGSICRGDISLGSDIDLLAIVEGYNATLNPDIFSIYSHNRVQEIWQEGNPFAWHLFLEAQLIFSSDKIDYLKELGSPERYKNSVQDCEKFLNLFCEAYDSIIIGKNSKIFDLSTIFLSIRNIATCFSLGSTERPSFSRNSALCLGVDNVPITLDAYQILERSRILCTRGHGKYVTNKEIDIVIPTLQEVYEWMNYLVEKAKKNERI